MRGARVVAGTFEQVLRHGINSYVLYGRPQQRLRPLYNRIIRRQRALDDGPSIIASPMQLRHVDRLRAAFDRRLPARQ